MHVRWLVRRDMPEVLEIENASFEFPWSESDFVSCLRLRNVIGMVAEHEREIVGFMIYELNKIDVHVLNIAVHPRFRRALVGTTMLEKLKAKLNKRRYITAEVRETNYAAQLWLKSCDFVCFEQVKNFYDETHEVAYRFRYDNCPTIKQVLTNRVREVSR